VTAYQDDIGQHNRMAREHLENAGIHVSTPARYGDSIPEWQVEGGHTMSLGYRPEVGYALSTTHYGDPSGNTMHAYLGTHEPGEVVDRATRALRHPEDGPHAGHVPARFDTGTSNPQLPLEPGALVPTKRPFHCR